MSASSPDPSPTSSALAKSLIGAMLGLVLLNLVLYFQWREVPPARPQLTEKAALVEGQDTIDFSPLDLERIHAQSLPDWALARVGLGQDQESQLYLELLDALQGEPTLTQIIHSLETNSAIPTETTAAAVLPLCWRWNQTLDRNGAPWRIRCNMVARGEEQWFYISTYQVVADIDVEIDQQAQRVRLLRRMDRTGAREPYLGHAGTQDEGALLVLDRIRDFALNSIWPLMDPAQDPFQDDLAKLLGPQLRSEIRRIMGEEYVSVLARTAGTRREMLVLWKDLDQVRSCRGLDHLRIPWSGPTQDNLFPLTTPKTNDAGLCPTASPDILGRLLQLTEDNADEAELLPALDQLVAWAAHPVTLHEARHLADRKQDGPSGPPCPGCSTSLTAAERSEVSAYLATLTHPSLATTARLQACQAFTQLPPESTHARALREILTQDLESMCTSALPDFIRRSRTAMARLLGRSASGQLPSDFPRRLPVALEPPVFERD